MTSPYNKNQFELKYPENIGYNVLVLYKYVTSAALREILVNGDLKISFQHDANDPYELRLAGTLPDEGKSADFGFISFSDKHDIASLWGNYAEHFKGACLKFEIPYFAPSDNQNDSFFYRTTFLIEKLFNIESYIVTRRIDRNNKANILLVNGGDFIVKCRYLDKRSSGTMENTAMEIPSFKGFEKLYSTLIRIAQKDKSWAAESEYRACIKYHQRVDALKNMFFTTSFIHNLTEIIITPYATHKKDKIQEFLNSGNMHNKNIKITETEFSRDTFSITLPNQ